MMKGGASFTSVIQNKQVANTAPKHSVGTSNNKLPGFTLRALGGPKVELLVYRSKVKGWLQTVNAFFTLGAVRL